MFIKELDIAIVNALGNLLADLMRAPPLDHVQPRPSIFSLRSRRRADEEIILEFTLQSVLLNMVGKSCWHFSMKIDFQFRDSSTISHGSGGKKITDFG